jgi:hypothetical protein
MRTIAFAVIVAALISMNAWAEEPKAKANAAVQPATKLHADSGRCPPGSEVDRACLDAQESAKRGKADDRTCPCVRSVAGGTVPFVDAQRPATLIVAPEPRIHAAPAAPTCAASDLSSAASCGGRCVDVRTDVHNCGRCSNECNATFSCQAGVCVAPSEPQGGGRWVPRVDKSTCPKGSETYIDEKDGGVKCWVNTSTN